MTSNYKSTEPPRDFISKKMFGLKAQWSQSGGNEKEGTYFHIGTHEPTYVSCCRVGLLARWLKWEGENDITYQNELDVNK